MQLGPFDLIFLGCVSVSAIYLAVDTAMKQSDSTASLALKLPAFIRTPKWNYLPLILMLCAGGLLFARAMGWIGSGYLTGGLTTNLQPVYDQKFENETVIVDGKNFIRCTLTNVTLHHDGDNFKITSATFYGVRSIETSDARVANVLYLLKGVNLIQNLNIEEMPKAR